MKKYNAKLIRIIDGDTIDAEIDVGFDVFVRKRIRLWGINTPETRSRDKDEVKAGKKALGRLAAILALANGEFELVHHGDGKFGRCLGELFVKEHSESVNQILINEGFAEVYE
jgi:micrococcal nuclease|tara:strand:+ start:391 stop:729 length:339 start_codon:yes stop_codon:yes gene_type:complete